MSMSNQTPLWQQTKYEAVGAKPQSVEIIRLPFLERRAKERPESLTEAERARLKQIADSKRAHQRYGRLYKRYVERSNAHIAAVQKALADGEQVPEAVLQDYPWLKGHAPT